MRVSSGVRSFDRPPWPGCAVSLLLGVMLFGVALSPAPGMGAQSATGAKPAPTAAELIARMEAALPREGTVVLSGVERVPRSVHRRQLARMRSAMQSGGLSLISGPPRHEFRQTISFKPGFYQNRNLSDKPPVWRQIFSDWSVWRADGSMLEAFELSETGASLHGYVTSAPYPAQLPHEFLFQPRSLQKWIDPATLTVTQNATNFFVACSPVVPASLAPRLRNHRIVLTFNRDGRHGGLPTHIMLSGTRGVTAAELSDFRDFGSGHLLPARFIYTRRGGWWSRSTGEVLIESVSPRFSDGPALTGAVVRYYDSRVTGLRQKEMRLHQAPPPLWLVQIESDWAAGFVRLPYFGPAPVRRFVPLIAPMGLLLGLALWQRRRLRRANKPVPARIEAIETRG